MSALAAPYAPRRPTETLLYGVVRDHLETFLRWARETYEKPIPRYVEQELRGYLRCGVFAYGFLRAHCDACGHDLLVAFSCKGRGVCPSCAGRRMANTAAHLVDRVLPDVPVRQFVLSLPFELRRLAAFDAKVLSAVARTFVDAVFASYRTRARDDGLVAAECGAITFVQRFGGSLNLNVHLHVVVLDGTFTREPSGGVRFHAAAPPSCTTLERILLRVRQRAVVWLQRHGKLDLRAVESRSNEPPSPTALDACATLAMHGRALATLPSDDAATNDGRDARPERPALTVDHDGFNLNADVRMEAGDDLGRERLCRYGARPPFSLERLRRLPAGRIAYRVKYVRRGRAKHRVMTATELLARLAALIPPPRYPLVRYHGVLAPRSAWRKHVVPVPRVRVSSPECDEQSTRQDNQRTRHTASRGSSSSAPPGNRVSGIHDEGERRLPETTPASNVPLVLADGVAFPAPNVVSVRHWNRLLGGILHATASRVDWATLLRRTFAVDALECPSCHG